MNELQIFRRNYDQITFRNKDPIYCMNLLIFPSELENENWHSLKQLAAQYPEHFFVVCNWGQKHSRVAFDLFRPWRIPLAIRDWKRAQSYQKHHAENLLELHEPTLSVHRSLESFKLSRIYDTVLRLYMRSKINFGRFQHVLAYGAYPALPMAQRLSSEMNLKVWYWEDKSIKHYYPNGPKANFSQTLRQCERLISEKSNCIQEFQGLGLHAVSWEQVFAEERTI